MMEKPSTPTIFSILLAAMLLTGCSGADKTVSTQQTGDPQALKQQTQATPTDIREVTVSTVSTQAESYLDLTGTVRSNDIIKVFSTVSGQVKKVLISEGSPVKSGDPLYIIGGVGSSKAVPQLQREIAQANYDAALKSFNVVKKANDSSLLAAELQLQSAKNQAAGSYIDLQVFDYNIAGIQDGIYYLKDSYHTTERKNQIDFDKTATGINQLGSAIDQLENESFNLERDLNMQIAQTTDPAAKAKLEEKLKTQKAEFSKQLDELYAKADTASSGLSTLTEATQLGYNQLLGQIQQAKTQGKTTYLNQQSLKTKLGLNGGTSDAVQLAEAGLAAAKVKNEAAMIGAKTQLELATLNLELAKAGSDGLIVKAPIDGIVGEIIVHSGDIVGQQSQLTSVSGLNDYELRVAISAESASKIALPTNAEVLIGGKYLELPVKSIATGADPSSRLVNVAIQLPRIGLRNNQTMKVRIPYVPSRKSDGKMDGNIYIPLDAVIIGTEEQYVYLLKDGKAARKGVKLGEITGTSVQIIEGLTTSDQIIVEGAKNLTDGQQVAVK